MLLCPLFWEETKALEALVLFGQCGLHGSGQCDLEGKKNGMIAFVGCFGDR